MSWPCGVRDYRARTHMYGAFMSPEIGTLGATMPTTRTERLAHGSVPAGNGTEGLRSILAEAFRTRIEAHIVHVSRETKQDCLG